MEHDRLASPGRPSSCSIRGPPLSPMTSNALLELSTSPPSTSTVATSPSSSGSSSNPRVLRRKRSSANAALTGRPSQLSLRDRATSNAGGPGYEMAFANRLARMSISSIGASAKDGSGSGASGTSAQGNSSAQDGVDSNGRLRPSLERLVLLHTSTPPRDEGAGPRLAHALFRPNVVVDGLGRVARIQDQPLWNRLCNAAYQAGTLALGPTSGDVATAGVGLEASSGTRMYDLTPEGCPFGSRSVSTLYFGWSVSNPASIEPRAGPLAFPSLAKLRIHGIGDAEQVIDLGSRTWQALPDPLRDLLEMADEELGEAVDKAGSLSGPTASGDPELVREILDLVRGG